MTSPSGASSGGVSASAANEAIAVGSAGIPLPQVAVDEGGLQGSTVTHQRIKKPGDDVGHQSLLNLVKFCPVSVVLKIEFHHMLDQLGEEACPVAIPTNALRRPALACRGGKAKHTSGRLAFTM